MSDLKCEVKGCIRNRYGKEYCAMHYKRLKTRGYLGDPLPEDRRMYKKCSIEGCIKDHYGLGFCGMHYQRLIHKGDVGPTESLYESLEEKCKVVEWARWILGEYGKEFPEC